MNIEGGRGEGEVGFILSGSRSGNENEAQVYI